MFFDDTNGMCLHKAVLQCDMVLQAHSEQALG